MQNVTDNIYILVTLGTGGTFLMVGSFILIYIRNQNKILIQRQQLQYAEIAHQKQLLQAIIESQEAERKRIGQDLHDDVGTALSSLRLTIEMFKPGQAADNNSQHIKLSKDIIDKVIKDVRHISHNLSPPGLTYYGLVAAIEEKSSIINQSGSLAISLINEAEPVLQNLPLPVSVAFYRVLEELINNTIKHAGATTSTIKFTVSIDDMLIIEYADNGKGLHLGPINKGMGMQNIESRLTVINATYKIASGYDKGFMIKIEYPLDTVG
jgi:signal transduction histidine kinase